MFLSRKESAEEKSISVISVTYDAITKPTASKFLLNEFLWFRR